MPRLVNAISSHFQTVKLIVGCKPGLLYSFAIHLRLISSITWECNILRQRNIENKINASFRLQIKAYFIIKLLSHGIHETVKDMCMSCVEYVLL